MHARAGVRHAGTRVQCNGSEGSCQRSGGSRASRLVSAPGGGAVGVWIHPPNRWLIHRRTLHCRAAGAVVDLSCASDAAAATLADRGESENKKACRDGGRWGAWGLGGIGEAEGRSSDPLGLRQRTPRAAGRHNVTSQQPLPGATSAFSLWPRHGTHSRQGCPGPRPRRPFSPGWPADRPGRGGGSQAPSPGNAAYRAEAAS